MEAAREKARAQLGQMREGIDPKAQRAKQKADAATLADALEDFLAGNRTLREKSRADYRMSVGRYLTPWLDRPLRSITREMVEERHAAHRHRNRQRWSAPAQASANAAMKALAGPGISPRISSPTWGAIR